MKKYIEQWEKWHKELNQYGHYLNPVIGHAMDGRGIDYNSEYYLDARILIKFVKTLNHKKIIEIGPGYGALCKILMLQFPKIIKYTHVDHANMLKFTKDFLVGFGNIEFYDTDSIEKINEEFDTFISFNCLAETPLEYQIYIYEKFFPVCKEIFILQGMDDKEMKNKLIEYLNRNNFKIKESLGHEKSIAAQRILYGCLE